MREQPTTTGTNVASERVSDTRPSPRTRIVAGLTTMVTELRGWPARRWWIALASGVVTVVFIAIPTALIETPLFGREVPPTVWSWPVLVISAVLAGLVTATYVSRPADASIAAMPEGAGGRLGLAGWMVTFFAVGCPVCNKLVLLALGATGAMQYFEPVQPYLAAASIILLAWALYARVTRENSCRIPARLSPIRGGSGSSDPE
jgi:hypothetical protein